MNKILTAAAAAFFVSTAGTAFAQQEAEPKDKPLSIRLGVLFPGGYAAQNSGGKTLFSLGTDYVFSQSPGGSKARGSVYLDGAFGSKNSGHVNVIGVGVAVRTSTPIGSHSSGIAPYAGLGVGLYDTSVKIGAVGSSQNKTGIGGKAFVGVALGGQFFVEANYLALPKNNGLNASGFGVQIGTSF